MNKDESKQLLRFLVPEGAEDHRETELLRLTEETERICRLRYSSGGTERDLLIYVHKDNLIMVCHEPLASFRVEMKEAEQAEGIRGLLLDGISLPAHLFGESPALLMAKHEYDEIRKRADSSSLSELRRHVELKTGDSLLSAQFAQSMKCRHTSGELRICSRGGSRWSSQYASFFGDGSCGWLLRMSCEDKEDWLSATPVGKEQFCATFLHWLLHLKPLIAGE